MGKKERYEVLYEDLIDKVKAIAEGHQILLHAIHENTDRLERKIDGETIVLKDSIKLLQIRIDDVESKLSQRIDGVEGRLNNLSYQLQQTKDELGRKIDNITERLDNHEIRIQALEKKAD